MTTLLRLCLVLLPWPIRRHALQWFLGYEIHPTARIGRSWIFPRRLVMHAHARIGDLNVAVHLDRMEIGAHASIGRSNWITGFPKNDARHFSHLPDRRPELHLGAHSAVTKQHHLDCTERIEIGAFTTIAGYGSQLLTHSIDVNRNRQDAAPINLGEYCFVGTDVVILGGAELPARSVLGAKSLLNKRHAEPGWLYAGVPAQAVKPIPPDAAYFSRTRGFVS